MGILDQLTGGAIGSQPKNGARYKSSPPFPFQNTIIGSAGSTVAFWGKDLEADSGDWQHYYPFNHISIQNNSAYSVEFWIENRFIFVVANRSQREYEGEFRTFRLSNQDATNSIAADLIDVTVWNE